MKRLLMFLILCAVFAACSSSKTKSSASIAVSTKNVKTNNYETIVREAILVSDLNTFQNNIDNANVNYTDLLYYTIGICDPYRRQFRSEKVKFVCDKENNAQIIKLLIEKGADPNKKVFYRILEADTRYLVQTLADNVSEWNPAALKYILPQMDKCLIALTKMQKADPSKAKYFAFADFWRDNSCNVETFNPVWAKAVTKRDKTALLIGKTKEDVKAKYGEPTVYAHPSSYREILTYKKAEERQERGQYEAGVRGVNIFTDEVHYIFTLDRGVVTKVQVQVVNTTQGGGQTQEIDLEKAKQEEIAKKEKLAGTVEDSFAKKRALMRTGGRR